MELKMQVHPMLVPEPFRMLKLYLSFIILLQMFNISPSRGQDLVNSRRNSYYTFIYKINNEQAKELHKDVYDFDRSFLTNLYDFYPSDSNYKKELPVGHYIFAKAAEGELAYEIKSANNVQMVLLNNHRDLIMVFHDSAGRELSDLNVFVKSRRISFDIATKSYTLKKTNKKGLVSVIHNGHTSYFRIDRMYNNTLAKRVGGKVIHSFPVNHILSPVIYLKNNVRNVIVGSSVYPPGIYYRVRKIFKPKPHTGYIAFNKPKYRPLDTLLVKGFITTIKGKPYAKPVDIYITENYSNTINKKLASVSPYRSGAYKFEFKLVDSLNLSLDNNYNIEFRSKRGHILLSSSFGYEQYELKQNNYSVRSESNPKGKPSLLFLKGVDSNDMPLYDVRVEVLLKPKNIKKYHDNTVFVADTLWLYKTTLEPVGDTKIVLPDSVMPDVTMDYEAVVSFLNAENERINKNVSLTYTPEQSPIFLELKNDSLLITSSIPALPAGATFLLETYDIAEESSTKYVTLPHREKISYFATDYFVSYNDHVGSIFLDEHADNLEIFSNRTKDSIFVSANNPRLIPFRYFLFKNQRLIKEGYGESLQLRRKSNDKDNFSLSVQYVWAGAPVTREYNITYEKNVLDVKLDHAPLVYPGQKARFTITVKDATGKPVENADLTSYAITGKFKSLHGPSVPLYSKPKRERKIFNEFETKVIDDSFTRMLEFSFWKHTLGLDSITFYKFLYPDAGYFENRIPAEDAQVAPFVVGLGDVYTVQAIYIDGQPVYYRGTDNVQPYSFSVRPGVHNIDLRIANALISLKDIRIDSAQKLIFSVDRFNLPAFCEYKKLPSKFSDQEIAKLSRYFVTVESRVRPSFAYLQQGNRYHLLEPTGGSYRTKLLTGPFYLGPVTYVNKSGFDMSFSYEPFYGYEFQERILKLRELKVSDYLRGDLSWPYFQTPSFKDLALTHDGLQSKWESIHINSLKNFKRFPDYIPSSRPLGKLILHGQPEEAKYSDVAAIFIVNLDHPDEYYVYPHSIKNIAFSGGHYQAMLIFTDKRYFKADSIFVKPYGINYYDLSHAKIRAADSLSGKVFEMISKWSESDNYNVQEREVELQEVRSLYYNEASIDMNFDHTVNGQITDEEGLPLPGVNVVVKGLAVGTVSDAQGYYTLNCPSNSTLVFSFIGYVSNERQVKNVHHVDVIMQADIQQLSEVVVVGYSEMKKKSLTASVHSVLSGKVAGVEIDHATLADSVTIKVRGLSSITPDAEPLVILDGRIVKLEDVDKGKITAIEILKSQTAISIYGSRAVNGVILVSTKPGANAAYLQQVSKTAVQIPTSAEILGNSIRKNFKDYAFWKPALKTDHNGIAKFEVTFPDDITGWNAYVLAMAGKRKSGQVATTIQSYKPLMAQIAQPHFLIKGDHAVALGKITNYGQDDVELNRTLTINGERVMGDLLKIRNSKVDSISLDASTMDSITVRYDVTYKDYTDGELRKIPVLPRGVKETTGMFFMLDKDTTFTLNINDTTRQTTLYAHADLLDVLLDEIEYLKTYAYNCNEQLASRLQALLLEKKIKEFKDDRFDNKREIEKIIKKLVSYQNNDGSWSWWQSGGGNIWVTLHVAKVLSSAERDGYTTRFDRQAVFNYLEADFEKVDKGTKLDVLLFMLEQGQRIMVKDVVDTLTRSKYITLRENLITERLLQLDGQKPDMNKIQALRSSTLKGNVYWGEDKLNLFDNEVVNTLIAFRIIEKEDPAATDLNKIRNYLLERRGTCWRNTYESALILETLLPGLMRKAENYKRVTLNLSGGLTRNVDTFPFKVDYRGSDNITIAKTGTSPVYFTAYHQQWNSSPVKFEKDFVVSTSFEHGNNNLTVGKPTKLNIKVEVKGDAEYVMIEVPIPAGCSYEGKLQPRSNGEVHREYDSHKTSIFCEHLKKGTYNYTINLLPRYSGRFTLNPAVVELMYFPSIYGREKLKQIDIK